LRNLKTTNAEFWGELTGQELDDNLNQLPKSDETLSEDIEPDASLEDNDADDSDLSIQTLINVMIKKDLPAGVGTRKSGALTSIVDAENSVDIPLEPVECIDGVNGVVVESRAPGEQKKDGGVVTVELEGPGPSRASGRGMRKKLANRLYDQFWRHNDDDGSDDDTVLP
jgi:hypothetical protein